MSEVNSAATMQAAVGAQHHDRRARECLALADTLAGGTSQFAPSLDEWEQVRALAQLAAAHTARAAMLLGPLAG